MAKIIVFNNDTNRMETYYRNENEPMSVGFIFLHIFTII